MAIIWKTLSIVVEMLRYFSWYLALKLLPGKATTTRAYNSSIPVLNSRYEENVCTRVPFGDYAWECCLVKSTSVTACDVFSPLDSAVTELWLERFFLCVLLCCLSCYAERQMLQIFLREVSSVLTSISLKWLLWLLPWPAFRSVTRHYRCSSKRN